VNGTLVIRSNPVQAWRQFANSSFSQRPTAKIASEKELRAERGFGWSGLFPVSEGYKLIQNFLQSLEPPFLVGGCPSIPPVHLRAVRFTNRGYFFPKFLDTL
jgi:hypothetical protein